MGFLKFSVPMDPQTSFLTSLLSTASNPVVSKDQHPTCIEFSFEAFINYSFLDKLCNKSSNAGGPVHVGTEILHRGFGYDGLRRGHGVHNSCAMVHCKDHPHM